MARAMRCLFSSAARKWDAFRSRNCSIKGTVVNTKTINPQIDNPPRSVHRFTIREFERLVRIGFLNPGDRAELIDGWLVDKMPHNPRHAGVVDIANKAIE